MGPELNEKKCWLVSDNTEGIEIFDKSQEQCKSGIKWLEYRKGKWEPLWLYRMSDYGNIPDTEGVNKKTIIFIIFLIFFYIFESRKGPYKHFSDLFYLRLR